VRHANDNNQGRRMTSPVSGDALVGHLYDAVMAPSGFQQFIEALCPAFQLISAGMLTRHGETQEVKGLWLHGMSQKSFASYTLDYARDDILAHHMMVAPIGSFYASNLDIPHPERFPESRFYQEWVLPHGLAYAAGSIVLREGAWLTQLFVQRTPEHPPFTREEMHRLDQLVSHIQRAMQMRQRFAELQLEQNFLASSLDVLAMPTLLIDEYGRVVHANRSAGQLLEGRSALWLEDGHLFTRDEAVTRSINLEVSNAIRASRGIGADPCTTVLLSRSARAPLIIMIAPMQFYGGAAGQGAALLFAFDPEIAPSVVVEVVRALFGLSGAEAQLAVALGSGKTLEDAAQERGTSIHTIRTQLKSIFNKTGTKRQSDLVALLLSSPAYFLARHAQPEGL
jgi:DNA-binding CsgD family transcriptional regulator/PAS domain-containing protein